MKILAISDLHSDQNVLSNLDIFLSKEKFDLAIIPGDMTNPNFQAIEYIHKLNQIFTDYNQQWFCVHGNNDREDVIDFLRQNHLDLHYEPQEINGYKFIGIGSWGYELPPYELKFDDHTIFVTHIPPRRNPLTSNLKPQTSPLIHLSGHIHNSEKFYDLSPTRIINIPSAKFSSRAAIITLPKREVIFFNLPQKSLI